MIDALFIDPKGPYPGLLGAEHCWDEKRDARTYAGEGPCVLHPPCAAWCSLAGLREHRYGLPQNEDGGCFASALATLLRCGGVLEHPAYSKAWPWHGIAKPGKRGTGWREIEGKTFGGRRLWTCVVSQVAYGHRARKRTYLLYCGYVTPFELDWSEPPHVAVVSGLHNHCTKPARGRNRVWGSEAKRSPIEFACTLIRLAEHAWIR